jgi:DNA (cytosine-5)-methyltransferase 1
MKQLQLSNYFTPPPRRNESVLDFYAGMGGLGSGFDKYFYVAVAVDMNRDAVATYQANHKKCRVYLMNVADYVNSCPVKDFEIITGVVGGPPCQDFSVLNKNRDVKSCRASQMDVMIQAILTLQPQFALIENVKSIPKFYKDRAVQSLERAGYKVVAEVIQAYDYGSVQKRPRWILTASKTKHIYPKGIPSGRTAKEILRNDKCEMKITADVLKAIQKIPSGKWSALEGSTYKAYFVVDPNKPMPAVVNPTKLRYVHPTRKRYLSMREMALAQGFPEGYIIKGNTLKSKGQQLANAVPVELAEAFAKEFAVQFAHA